MVRQVAPLVIQPAGGAGAPPDGGPATDLEGLLRRGGGPGVAEGGDHLLCEAVEVGSWTLSGVPSGVAQMTRLRPG